MRVLYVDHISTLGIQMILTVTPKILHQILVDYFCMHICLWMECCIYIQLVSIFSPNIVQNVQRNLVSLSKMMLLGVPKCTQTCSKNMFSTFFPLMVFLQGIIMHILLNLSTTINKQSCPFLFVGKPPIKSMEIISQG
jgi:hypothetical protein